MLLPGFQPVSATSCCCRGSHGGVLSRNPKLHGIHEIDDPYANPSHLISAPGSARQKLRHLDVNLRAGARHNKAGSRNERLEDVFERGSLPTVMTSPIAFYGVSTGSMYDSCRPVRAIAIMTGVGKKVEWKEIEGKKVESGDWSLLVELQAGLVLSSMFAS